MTEILLRIGNVFFQFVNVMIIVNVMLRFIIPEGKGPISGFVLSMTEPFLRPLRKFLRFQAFDFSAIAVVLLIEYAIRPMYAYLVIRLFG